MKFIHIICLSLALSASSLSATVSAQTGTGYFLHTVTKGQSLYSIASMYHVSVDDIVRLNPGSKEQIRAGQALKIPQAQYSNEEGKQFHTIQAGETLYQLTLKYHVTAQAICKANPGLSAENFRIGQVIVIPAQDNTPAQTEQTAQAEPAVKKNEWRDMHKVARKETIFSISQQYGITQEELIAANPELKNGKLKKGSFLFIPYPKSQETGKTAPSSQAAPSNEELFKENSISKKQINTIKVALMLPFTSTSQDEQSRMVEFYEGFLMAIDSLKHQGVSADIYIYDTKGTTAGTNAILSQNKLKDMDIIFGPAHQSSIASVAAFADKNNIRLVVPFSPKVDQVFANPNIYQVNTPQSYLYSKVYEHFIRKFGKTNVIFVDDGSGDKEKAEFIKGMKNELKDNNVRFKQIQLAGDIDPNKVIAAMDTLQENIFIPTSGRSSALTRVLPHLTLVRREHPHFDMHLFGYPEWQTYTQDFLANFYELDTYFYSSFYTNNLFPAAINFTQSYRRWYSKDMSNTYPKYGMLGFDVGYFFLKGLSQQGNKLEENLNRVQVTPIQTGFCFERVNNWGGFINRKVFFVHFTKDYELIKLDFE
ncbi:LysM peptidoglycan-binding domain-containing protein [Phocaeicola coprocola]|uniref:LysM peptidoglycan-binding domain-containing protein n=1 Tax=Phocaeicola coprocola TaxID=310298 RepID=UPI003FEEA4DF